MFSCLCFKYSIHVLSIPQNVEIKLLRTKTTIYQALYIVKVKETACQKLALLTLCFSNQNRAIHTRICIGIVCGPPVNKICKEVRQDIVLSVHINVRP
jgi:hypothetical protein